MTRPPPLMETRKVLQGARPPVGEGPPTRAVLAGLRRLRPPVPVLVAAALMALVPLALLAVAGVVVVDAWREDSVLTAVATTALLGGTLVLLAALAWRGVKRALHFGAYDQGLFLARLTTVVCLVAGGFLLWYVVGQGNPQEPSMLVPVVVLALVWLPLVPLQAPAAKAWPDRVVLRSGPQVRSRRELGFLLDARPHSCAAPLPVDGAVEVADEEGRGWVWRGSCPACGLPALTVVGLRAEDTPDPADPLAWGRPGSRPALGGGDLLYLGDRYELPAGQDPAVLSDDQLHLAWAHALASVQATEELLALVPAGEDAVPAWRRTGRPVPLTTPSERFGRAGIEGRLGVRRSALQALEVERARRGWA